MTAAREYGMKLRLHADEFKDSGAASLAAELKVSSADHLMHVSEEAISDMAQAGVVATLLPGQLSSSESQHMLLPDDS